MGDKRAAKAAQIESIPQRITTTPFSPSYSADNMAAHTEGRMRLSDAEMDGYPSQ
jgi:hypothetical protein